MVYRIICTGVKLPLAPLFRTFKHTVAESPRRQLITALRKFHRACTYNTKYTRIYVYYTYSKPLTALRGLVVPWRHVGGDDVVEYICCSLPNPNTYIRRCNNSIIYSFPQSHNINVDNVTPLQKYAIHVACSYQVLFYQSTCCGCLAHTG